MADFKYTYAGHMGADVEPINGLEFSASHTSAVSEDNCEDETFYNLELHLSLPATFSTGKYYCLKTAYQGETVFGWFRPTDFNSGGITFSYMIFEPNSGPDLGNTTIIPGSPLFLSSGEGQTLLINKCFDLTGGQSAACNSSAAEFRYVDDGDLSFEPKNGTGFTLYGGVQPTKAACESEIFASGNLDLATFFGSRYYCYKTVAGSDTAYGWLQVANFDDQGMTFNYTTYAP